MLHVPGLFIAHSEGRGRGVFTAHDIDKGDLIEVAPLIIIPKEEIADIHKTKLHDYYFLWPQPSNSACIALGYASLYNHNFQPNAQIIMDLEKQEFEITCTADIKAGQEIFLDYLDGGKDISQLWFEPV